MQKKKMSFGEMMRTAAAHGVTPTTINDGQTTEPETEQAAPEVVAPAAQEAVQLEVHPDTPEAQPPVTQPPLNRSSGLDIEADRVALVRQLVFDYKQRDPSSQRLTNWCMTRFPRKQYAKLVLLRTLCGVSLYNLMGMLVERFMQELEMGLDKDKTECQ